MREMLQRELALNRGIDAAMNDLLKGMKELVDGSRIYQSRMEIHQMSNLVAVAQETDSVEVIKHYILYQVGRDTRNESWHRRMGSARTFGEELVSRLDSLHDLALGMVSEVTGTSALDVDRTWIKLTRLYLGHLRRYFYYLKKEKGGGR